MGVISVLQTAGGIGNTGFSASGASEPATAARGAEITAEVVRVVRGVVREQKKA